ncbi:glycoside hydrolase family 3 protein [Niveibacterium sp. COAC-50]|uniref:glycoside hydrolase family 3 protein n=1 Tax=Niveibacterium sp. COAC-50 TaxID=2729384 RepID=UPI001C132481
MRLAGSIHCSFAAVLLCIAACDAGVSHAAKPASAPTPAPVPKNARYKDASQPVEARVEDLLARMTLAEKIGQMTQAERAEARPGDVTALMLGSVLSGGGSGPSPNKPESWASMIDAYQDAATATRLGIPVIYGIDAVHGHQSVIGATVFPQMIGLAAAGDADLMKRIGEVTAREMAATGIYWNFSPMVAVTQDIRWGRAAESLGEDAATVGTLATAYVGGLMAPIAPDSAQILPTAKHFIGDGGTAWGSSRQSIMGVQYRLDQGDAQGDSEALLARYLPPYKALIDAGTGSVMASFSSWNGDKLHGNNALLTGVLKERLGFKGFVISDWDGIQQLPGSFEQQVTTAINAGVDMAMVPKDYRAFVRVLTDAVNKGSVPQARIDDAVRRILRAKFAMGLFEHPRALRSLQAEFGGAAHRAVAREAVAKSATLLKNAGALPLARGKSIFVAGEFADNLGFQSGGWTLQWQGVSGNGEIAGTTLLEGIKQVGGATTAVSFKEDGKLDGRADVGIVFVGEPPYAEGVGDRDIDELALDRREVSAIDAMRSRVDKLVLVVVAGRPQLLDKVIDKVDAVVMAWLPGSEGAGLADVLLGDKPFTGRLPVGWPASAAGYQRADAPLDMRCTSLVWALGDGMDVSGKALGPGRCTR